MIPPAFVVVVAGESFLLFAYFFTGLPLDNDIEMADLKEYINQFEHPASMIDRF